MFFLLLVQHFVFLFGRKAILLVLIKSTEKITQPSCAEKNNKEKGKREKSGKEDERKNNNKEERDGPSKRGDVFLLNATICFLHLTMSTG